MTMMMHQNRTKLGGEFDHIKTMRSTHRFHLAIEEIQGYRGSHWTTYPTRIDLLRLQRLQWLSNFLHQKSEKKYMSANDPFETSALC